MIHTFTLKKGLPYGTDDKIEWQVDVELQELNAGMMLAAQEASEKVVMVTGPNGLTPELVASPTILGAELIRRRIKKIGVINGPLARELLNKLTPEDFQTLNDEIDKMDAAALLTGTDTTGAEAAARGRLSAVSEGN